VAVSGIVYGGSGLDWDPSLLQCRGADDVPVVDAGAGNLHVSAGAAGRHGGRQRGVGRVGVATGSSGSARVVRAGHGAGIGKRLAASVDGGGVENGSGSGKRLAVGIDLRGNS